MESSGSVLEEGVVDDCCSVSVAVGTMPQPLTSDGGGVGKKPPPGVSTNWAPFKAPVVSVVFVVVVPFALNIGDRIELTVVEAVH